MLCYMFYESLTRLMVKEFFIQIFYHFLIFIKQTFTYVVLWYMERVETHVCFFVLGINQDYMSTCVTHSFDLFYPQKALQYVKNFLNESFYMSISFLNFNKGICVCCTVAQYMMRSIAVLLLQLNYATFVSLGDYLTL